MKPLSLLLFVCLFNAAFDDDTQPPTAISYFTNVRTVSIAQTDKQNYFVVDPEIWIHSRPDLGDLRLYDGSYPVQYSISEQLAGVLSEQAQAKVLNLGSVSGHTEFDLEINNLPEYDRIHLNLNAKDFIVTASVSGANALAGSTPTNLPSTTLYDFTHEQLGSNSVLKLPPSNFRYLHVKLTSGIRPEQVKGASIYNLREKQALWTEVGSCGAPQEKPRLTVIVCDIPEKVPVNRLEFQVPPDRINFLRNVRVEDTKGMQLASGEISRVRINRPGGTITDERLKLDLNSRSGRLTLTIDNADNAPLEITAARPLSLERRIYFEPQGKAELHLYYGDEKLSSPVYDYARFFHADASAAEAQLSAGAHNAQYTGRPDARPWSERHTGTLWSAMVLAVLVLAVVAIRGMRAEGSR